MGENGPNPQQERSARSRGPPPRKITSFDLFEVLGAFSGLVLGIVIGARWGILGGISGAIVGLLVGHVVGQLPFRIGSWQLLRELRRTSTEDLRNQLEERYFISHLIIAQLLIRGEPLESFRSVVADQLNARCPDVRRFGEHNAWLWFPEMIEED